MLFKQIIEEAYTPEKNFDSQESLISAIKSILRKVSFPRAKEVKSKADKGFEQPTKFGYVYKFFNGNVTISFIGAEVRWISELMKSLTTEKINFHYNKKTEMFLIKSEENVKQTKETYPEEVQEELESGTYYVIGAVAESKAEIKDVIENFNTVQRKIYNFLFNNDLIVWGFVKLKQKYVYKLTVKEEGF